MIALGLRHHVPEAQSDLALAVAASVLRTSEVVRLPVAVSLIAPPIIAKADLTPMLFSCNHLVAKNLLVLDGSQWALGRRGPRKDTSINGPSLCQFSPAGGGPTLPLLLLLLLPP